MRPQAASAQRDLQRQDTGLEHAAGRYDSPRGLAQSLCSLALWHWLDAQAKADPPSADRGRAGGRPLRILDASAGEGAFLEGAVRALEERARLGSPPKGLLWPDRVEVVGLEASAEAAARARANLSALLQAGVWGAYSVSLETCNALQAQRTESVLGRFDLAVGNPPFVESAAMKLRPDLFDRRAIRDVFESARGNFDAFVPFVELSLRALRPGGVACLILPNKFLAAPYASAARSLCLREAELCALVDLSRAGAFAAGVYPIAAVLRKRGGRERSARRQVDLFQALGRAGEGGLAPMGQGDVTWLEIGRGMPWSCLLSPLAPLLGRLLENAQLLGAQAEIRGAATVAEAYQWLEALEEADGEGALSRSKDLRPLLCSGAIRPFHTLWGLRPSRYLGRKSLRPALRLSCAAISQRRKAQIRAEKLIVSGLALRPAAFWDWEGAAGAKSTVLITQAQMGFGPVAAYLNSRLGAAIYRTLFGGLALAGGYLRIGPQQLRGLFVPALSRNDIGRLSRLARKASEAGRLLGQGKKEASETLQRARARIDLLLEKAMDLSESDKLVLPSAMNPETITATTP